MPWLVRMASLSVFFLAWELYGRAQETTLTFVPFTDMISAFYDMVQTREFWEAYRETFVPFLYGWLLGIAVGVSSGLLIGRFHILDRMSRPYTSFLLATPISTLVPLVVILFGIGIEARASIVFLFAVVEITLNTATGVRYVDKPLIEMAQSFGASERRMFQRVILPGAMPGIMAGLRIGTGRAVVGMIVVELLLVSVGVGRLISRFRGRFETAELFAVVFSLCILGILVLTLVRLIERRALHWKVEASK